MKRITCLLCALLLLLSAGCGSEKPDPTADPTQSVSVAPETPTPEPTPTPTPEPAFYHPLTGLPCEEDLSQKQPVAIMLNNLKAAQPQQGNSQADIIYELLAEGGITRMLAVYLEPEGLGLIGSVRSARQYYWEIAQGHDAVYIHAGASPEFYETKKSQNLFTVDGVNGRYSSAGAGMFWRDRDRVAGHHYAYEHSLLTSGEAITAMLEKENRGTHKDGYVYQMSFADDGTPAGGDSALTVTVPFSSYKTGVFRYDAGTGLYRVEEYGEPYIDGNDGSQVSTTNLLVLQTTYKVVDNAGRVQVGLSSGEGWFACGGKVIPITWEKGSADQQIRYFTQDGQPLTLGRGKSYVCFIPTSRTMTAE
ncbi:MAG: DUF3048 domain-containing protein [Clostridiales bacterium]|nr:DUF3048 domain-containing protein [Clostridiales bacterium]